MDWLRSRWDWIVRNKFLTCVVVFAVGLLVFGVVMVCRHWGWIVTESGSTILRNLGLVIGGLIAIGFGIWRGVVADRQAKASQDQAKTSQRGLLNERYQKGAEMLGSEVLAVRLGGIYALQHLAEDEPELYHVPIMRLFCAFMRNLPDYTDKTATTSPLTEIYEKKFRSDVMGIMRAIGNRSDADVELEKKGECRIVLPAVDLSGASLIKANLTDVVLFATNLTNANLAGANLAGASLAGANLAAANLSKAKGLTQNQLDQARADPHKPPTLEDAWDAKTGEPLEWRVGKPDNSR